MEVREEDSEVEAASGPAIEVAEANKARSSVSFTPSPPATAGINQFPPNLPHLAPIPIQQQTQASPLAPSTADKSIEELLARNNLVHFGDVQLSHVPDHSPGPLVIPMSYLFPNIDKPQGNASY